MGFVELQITTNFSFLHGGSHPEEFIRRAAAVGYRAGAITDRHTLAGIVRAHRAAKEIGFPLIIGSRVVLYEGLPEPFPERETHSTVEFLYSTEPICPFSLLLYPTTRAAYGELCSLLTLGKSRAPKGRCYLFIDDLTTLSDDLIAVVSVHAPRDRRLTELLQRVSEIFGSGDRLSMALSRCYGPDEPQRVRNILSLAKSLSLPLVATNDALYHVPERRKLQDVLTCIRKNCTLDEAGFSLLANAERYLKTPEEIARLFREWPEALVRTEEIAERALQFSLDEVRYEYPHEICPIGNTPQEYLTELTWKGASERYPQGVPEKVASQIEHELRVIKELNYAKYFLTVYDIVRFAHSRGILCQGRGAAANSAVCYCLGITAVDPDKINLLFERFVSRERNEPPDIDIDFEHERREEVIQYIYDRYGRHRAALVAEVITYRTRSAVRDVGKVFGMTPETICTLSRLLQRTRPEEINTYTLERIGLSLSNERLQDLLTLIGEIISFPRHLSQHVGGFIISETLLSEIVPIENAAMENRSVIEWDKDDVDTMGMLKIDCLGLGMLTCIRKAIAMINDRNSTPSPSSPPLTLHTIPREDPAVYEMISAADTIGVFQIESRAQMTMLPRLRPRCFYDLVIEVAIVRPGPIVGGMVHPLLRRRMGREAVSYPNEAVRKILEPTLGVPIFQEQVMQLVVATAGFTPGEADNLRRAMAKWEQNRDLAEQFGERIIQGMLKNGYTREYAAQLLQQIAGFGEYGFPQSHAASFALLVYVSSWIKYYYPEVFAAALLNSQPMGFYAPAQIIEDAKRHGVEVRGVDVHSSRWDCTVENDDTKTAFPDHSKRGVLRLGMRLVKGLEEREAAKIVATVRRSGPYTSLLRLWRESGARVSAFRCLARADAFRSVGFDRQRALWEIKQFRDERLPLFQGWEEREVQVELPLVPPPVEVFQDYVTTGLSLKGHPLRFLRGQLERWGMITLAELKSQHHTPQRSFSVAGLVLIRQRPSTAHGVLFMTIEDETGMGNLIIRPKVYERYRSVLSDSSALAVKGRYENHDGVIHLLVEEAADLCAHFASLEGLSRNFR